MQWVGMKLCSCSCYFLLMTGKALCWPTCFNSLQFLQFFHLSPFSFQKWVDEKWEYWVLTMSISSSIDVLQWFILPWLKLVGTLMGSIKTSFQKPNLNYCWHLILSPEAVPCSCCKRYRALYWKPSCLWAPAAPCTQGSVATKTTRNKVPATSIQREVGAVQMAAEDREDWSGYPSSMTTGQIFCLPVPAQ